MKPFDPLTLLVPTCIRGLLTPAHDRSEQSQRLSAILKVDVSELASIRMGPRFHYRPFSVAKRDGRERLLLAPSAALKTLQRRLLDNYLGPLPVHPSATAFRTGSSIIENARQHARQQLIATVDLRDFFESTRGARVRAFFVRQGWRDEGLQTLMRLCVYRDGLPQGAPTSPCLSNLVNVPLDQRLSTLAQRAGALYTRYGDDLTFSWNSDRMPDSFPLAIEDGMHAAGYEIQPRKGWQVKGITDRPCVTGLVLTGDGGVSVPWALRWRIWCLRLKSWCGAGDDVQRRLRGYEGYVRMVR